MWSLIASYVSVWSERNRACGVRAYVNFSPFRNGSVWLNSVFHWQKCPTLHEEQLNHVVLIRVWLFFPICRNRIDIKRPRCVSILMGLTKGFVSVSLEPACPGFHSLHLVYLDGSGSSTRNVNCHTYHVQTHVIFIFLLLFFLEEHKRRGSWQFPLCSSGESHEGLEQHGGIKIQFSSCRGDFF